MKSVQYNGLQDPGGYALKTWLFAEYDTNIQYSCL